MLQIVAIPALNDNYIWALINPKHHCALIVDPGDAEPVITFLHHQQLTLQGILVTHHHWDHVNGVEKLLQIYQVPVYGSPENPFHAISHRVVSGQTLGMNDRFPSFQIIAIPGHTLDHIAYDAQDHLFCGDTLFAGGCGRLFEGTPEQLYTSLQKIAALPDHTKLYCAHEYTLDNLRFAYHVEPTNQAILERIAQVKALRKQGIPSIPSLLHEEKLTNPFLRCTIPEIMQQAERYAQHKLSNPIAVFATLRAWKNNFS
jgi:hydroxyacylglutathione hydrolase